MNQHHHPHLSCVILDPNSTSPSKHLRPTKNELTLKYSSSCIQQILAYMLCFPYHTTCSHNVNNQYKKIHEEYYETTMVFFISYFTILILENKDSRLKLYISYGLVYSINGDSQTQSSCTISSFLLVFLFPFSSFPQMILKNSFLVVKPISLPSDDLSLLLPLQGVFDASRNLRFHCFHNVDDLNDCLHDMDALLAILWKRMVLTKIFLMKVKPSTKVGMGILIGKVYSTTIQCKKNKLN